MSTNFSRRQLLSTGIAAVGGTLAARAIAAEEEKAPAKKKGQLSLDELGNLLKALGLKTTRDESRFDFTFPVELEQEWKMSMSAVLSANENSIWIMAWLNELPKSAADVPRTALLRLLAENDKMGKAFFAYVPGNKRFALERMLDNENITTASFKEDLLDVARLVIDTQSVWTVSEWKPATPSPGDSSKDTKGTSSDDAPSILTGTGGAKPIKTATKDGPAAGSSAPKKIK
jgi:hypothetical protein